MPQQHLANAIAWGLSIWQVGLISGPALGGLVYGWAESTAAVYAGSAALYLCATVLVGVMKVRTGRMEGGATTLANVFAGVRYVWTQKLVLGAISLDLFAVLLGGAVALLPVYSRDILHAGPTALGLLRSAPAVGAAIVAITIAFKPIRRKTGARMLLCVGVFGLATVVFGASHNLVLSLVALGVLGASDMVAGVVRQTLVQLTTPAVMRGRVSAVEMVFLGASNQLGQLESGLTAAWFGTVPAVILGGVGTCLIAALYAWRFPELRRVDDLQQIQPAA